MRLPVVDKQDIRFNRLSVGGESFNKRVLAIAQDNHGFVWLGTDDGLYRYDGYSLSAYRHDSTNPRSLSDNVVMVIHKDRAGILWIGTGYGGLERFDPDQGAFTHFRHDPNDRGSLRDDHVLCIYQDRAGALWIGTGDGLDRLDEASGTFIHYSHPAEGDASTNAVHRLYEDAEGRLIVGSGRGLFRLEPSNNLSRFSHDPIASDILNHADFLGFARNSLDAVWLRFLSEHLLVAFDTKTGKLQRYAFGTGEARPNRVHEDRNGTLWMGSHRDGLLKFDKERRDIKRYTPWPEGSGPYQIWALLEDSEGNLWVGDESGVSRFQMASPQFVNYQHHASDPNSLRNNKVLSVHVDAQGFLWIGTTAGLHRLNRKTGQMLVYQHDPKNPNSLSHDVVSAIQEDGAGGLWIGTHGGGLNHFDRASGRLLAYRHNAKDPESLSDDFILCLLAEPGGGVWIGTVGGGVNQFNPVTRRFKTYRHDPRAPGALSDDISGSIYRDRTGTLWVGTNRGLNRFDPGTERFTVYLHDERDPASLSNEGITSIYEDHQGTLWIGTRRGLNRLHRTRGSFESFTTQNGLANDAIEGIEEDSRGNLWLATQSGLSEFHPKTKAVRNFSEANGLLGDFASPTGTNRSAVTREGELVFGSLHGVTVFNPDRVAANPYVPPVVLTDFFLFNKPVIPGPNSPLQQPIWSTRSLTLNDKQSIFTVGFAALSYVAPERNRYRYRLEHFENEWNEVGGERRVATYTNLPPGNYIFRVQGSNNDGIWNEQGVHLDINMLPPWWATWWFRTLAFVCMACLAFVAYRWRVRSLHLAASGLELQVAERTHELKLAKDAAESANRAKSSFLANMSHELRTPLNAILGFSSLLRNDTVTEKQRRDLEIINHSGEHLLTLINNILDLAKIEAGRTELRVESCDINRLVVEVTNMMRVRANEKNLRLIVVEGQNLPQFIRADTAKLRQILINLLGNAIKFTEKGTVTLRSDSGPANADGRRLMTFEVEDTGIGIASEDQSRIFEAFVQTGEQRNQKGTGLGLTISRQFAELMGGTIHIVSVLGKGSRFRVELPMDVIEKSQNDYPEAVADQIVGVDPGPVCYRILIVEDREENWLVLERLMQKAGFEVQIARDGATGIEVWKAWQPHFIWMDLRMPVMDGKEATRHIRALDGGKEVKIVAVTASAFGSERTEVLAAGLDDFVRKPFQPSEIYDCIARHLGLRLVYDKQPREAQPSVLTHEDFRELPPNLVRELADAITTLDQERILEVIARIRDSDSTLAGKLTYFADRFAYTPLMEAVRNHGKKGADFSGLRPYE